MHDKPSTAYRELVSGAPFALQELITGLGYPVEALPTGGLRVAAETLKLIAEELSKFVGKAPSWGWRYLRNVLNRQQGASAQLTQAIYEWGAVIDGGAPILANKINVTVRAGAGQLHPGSVILAHSKRCGNPKCRVAFVPVVPWQRYCRAECRSEAYATEQAKEVMSRPPRSGAVVAAFLVSQAVAENSQSSHIHRPGQGSWEKGGLWGDLFFVWKRSPNHGLRDLLWQGLAVARCTDGVIRGLKNSRKIIAGHIAEGLA